MAQRYESWALDVLLPDHLAAMRADLESRDPIQMEGGSQLRIDVDASMACGWVTWVACFPEPVPGDVIPWEPAIVTVVVDEDRLVTSG